MAIRANSLQINERAEQLLQPWAKLKHGQRLFPNGDDMIDLYNLTIFEAEGAGEPPFDIRGAVHAFAEMVRF